MKDFTLAQYERYLTAIKNKNIPFYTYADFMKISVKPSSFCLVRHDVDRKPKNALNMAQLEYDLGVVSTYYFRTKSNTLKKKIIQKIEALGHEVGYHYENLSDTDGDMQMALKDFKTNLSKLREMATIQTCAMHGRPLKSYDNRDLWKNQQNHDLLLQEFKILGEVYLDIDYSDIAYINDTGRNWTSGKSNLRDKVISNIFADFNSGEELLSYLQENPHPKIVFQIHPERWSNNPLDWTLQYGMDLGVNWIKSILR